MTPPKQSQNTFLRWAMVKFRTKLPTVVSLPQSNPYPITKLRMSEERKLSCYSCSMPMGIARFIESEWKYDELVADGPPTCPPSVATKRIDCPHCGFSNDIISVIVWVGS